MSTEGGGLRGQWRLLAAVGAVATVGAFVGVRVAVARDGRVGSARSFVTVAGTLTNLPTGTTTATITFEFQRREGAATAALCAQTVSATIGVGGAFSVPVPVATPESTCPDDIFDGRDVWVRALYGGGEVAAWAPVNPVPYAHFASVAGVARQYETPDCPVGYERDVADPSFVGDMRLCKRFRGIGATRTLIDEVVRVGTGASAFWIDRYESSAVELLRDGSENTRFAGPDDIGALPRNGQWRTLSQLTPPTFARSIPAVVPARWITWLQAQETCRASGKRLPTGEEWLTAAEGTPDPPTAGDGMGVDGRCLTAVGGPRVTGGRAATRGAIGCESAWGAQDMIGNVNEWTAEWQAGVGTLDTSQRGTWPGAYGGDGTYNVGSRAYWSLAGDSLAGLPSTVYRGGNYGDRERAGILSYGVSNAATSAGETIGFRCVIPR